MASSISELNSIPLPELNLFTMENNEDLLSALSKELRTNILRYCDLTNISHSNEVTFEASIRHAKVAVQNVELPRKELKKTAEPTELLAFSYEDLKKQSVLSNGIYRGKLYGTLKDFTCNPQMECPECKGSGICSNCSGEKQITCPVCNGTTECPSCDATGKYTCPDCDGDGYFDCDDCDGTGTYKETCRACNGTGKYREGVQCRVCGGDGVYEKDCRTCGGSGFLTCDRCDGEGWIQCKACGGSGKCGKCRGRSMIWCPSCQGKGICFDCKGNKVVTCARCAGSGTFQSVDEYSFEEKTKTKKHCSVRGNFDIKSLLGTTLFDDALYDIFAKKTNTNNVKKFMESSPTEHKSQIEKWINIEKIAPSITSGESDDYFNMHVILKSIPATKLEFICRNKKFVIWIMGENKIIYYNKFPNWRDKAIGTIKKWFRKENTKI